MGEPASVRTQAESTHYEPPGMNIHAGETRSRERKGRGKAGLPLALARLDRAAIYRYGIGNRLGPA